LVVGPIARLEITRSDLAASDDNAIVEAQMASGEYRALGLAEGDTVVVSPRQARVFLDEGSGI
jgi:sulfate transport system ATP-binding protein